MQLCKGICAKWPAERVLHPHRVISASAGNSETVAAPQRWGAQCGVKRRSHHMDICCQVLALSSAHSSHPLSCCYKFLSFNWRKGVWKVLCSIQFITRIIHSNVPVNPILRGLPCANCYQQKQEQSMVSALGEHVNGALLDNGLCQHYSDTAGDAAVTLESTEWTPSELHAQELRLGSLKSAAETGIIYTMEICKCHKPGPFPPGKQVVKHSPAHLWKEVLLGGMRKMFTEITTVEGFWRMKSRENECSP